MATTPTNNATLIPKAALGAATVTSATAPATESASTPASLHRVSPIVAARRVLTDSLRRANQRRLVNRSKPGQLTILDVIPPSGYFARIMQILNSPERIEQGFLDACGFSVLIYLYARTDPVGFARFASGLYLNGKASFGVQEVMNHRSIDEMRQISSADIDLADWYMLQALINSLISRSYYARNYETDLLTSVSAALYPWTMPKLYAYIGLRRIRFLPLVGLGSTATVVNATELISAGGKPRFGIALVPARRLDKYLTGKSKFFEFPNHWIVLIEPIERVTVDGETKYHLSLVTWGEVRTLRISGSEMLALVRSLEIVEYR